MNRLIQFAAVSLSLVSLVSFAAITPGALAASRADLESDLVEGGQYTAALDQSAGRWQILPMSGEEIDVKMGTCGAGTTVATGYWLLMVDAEGRPELVAPSITETPVGSARNIAVRSCEEAGARQLGVPRIVLDALVENTGGIYVRP